MKLKLTILIVIVVFNHSLFSQSLSINTTGAIADPSAILDISSTNKGALIPRLSIAQREALSNPAIGLMIYSVDCDEFQVYNGTIWKTMSGTAACNLPGPPGVVIGNQKWMVKNLDVANYRNGDPIPKVTSSAAWDTLTTGAYCYFNNDSVSYAAIYGKLYNCYAVSDPRGLAPLGWHIPSDSEWTSLSTGLGGSSQAGGKMKKTGTTDWANPNTGATNSCGFTAIPAGCRYPAGFFFSLSGTQAFFWTSTADTPTYSYYRTLYNTNTSITRSSYDNQFGFSVRCVKD